MKRMVMLDSLMPRNFRGQFYYGRNKIAKDYFINEGIKSDRVLVIDEHGKQMGVLLTKDAVNHALLRSLDLVEISPHAKPPVCKIMDYGKHKYKLTRKERTAKKQSRVKTSIQKTKEVKFKTRTGDNELDWKIKQVKKFLSKGNKVKFKEGMIVSNAPGYYERGKFGIRIENLITVIKEKKDFKFSNLTLAPIDKTLIEKKLLNKSEINWLNDYHYKVFKHLKKFMNKLELIELKNSCSNI